MEERQDLQSKIKTMRGKQEEERKSLFRDLSYADSVKAPEKAKEYERKTYPDDELAIITDDDRDLEKPNQKMPKNMKDKGFER